MNNYSPELRRRKTWHHEFNAVHCDDNRAFYVMKGMFPAERACTRTRQGIEGVILHDLITRLEKGKR